MKTRNLFALAASAAVLIAVAPSARAQLPPSPSDAPTGERAGVRPTPAPRTPPPPPPDGNRRPAPRPGRVAPSPPVVPPPPPPDVTPSSPSLAPAPLDKVFGTRGVLELGGSCDFSVGRDIVADTTWLKLGLDAYAGYFVTRYFTLGMYLSVSFEQNKFAGSASWVVEPGFMIAPGVAARVARRVFLYGDLLGGLYVRPREVGGLEPNRSTDVRGAVGAELGVKLRIAGRLLLRLGVRPIYFAGKRKGEDEYGSLDGKISWFTFLVRIGLSGFL